MASATVSSPVRMPPQSTSMSSFMRSYIGVLVASLMEGAGFIPVDPEPSSFALGDIRLSVKGGILTREKGANGLGVGAGVADAELEALGHAAGIGRLARRVEDLGEGQGEGAVVGADVDHRAGGVQGVMKTEFVHRRLLRTRNGHDGRQRMQSRFEHTHVSGPLPTIYIAALRIGGAASGSLAWYWRLPRALRAPLPRPPRGGRTARSSEMKTEQERAAHGHERRRRTQDRADIVRIGDLVEHQQRAAILLALLERWRVETTDGRVSLDFRARKVRFQLRRCGSTGLTCASPSSARAAATSPAWSACRPISQPMES